MHPLIVVLALTMLYGCATNGPLSSETSRARATFGDSDISLPSDVARWMSNGRYEAALPAVVSHASKGDIEAAFVLAQFHLCGRMARFSCSTAERLLLTVSESDSASPELVRRAQKDIAWINAACEDSEFSRDVARALHFARQALRNDDPYSIDRLAAARANANGFYLAATDQARALEALKRDAERINVPQSTLTEFEERYELYSNFKPARFGAGQSCSFFLRPDITEADVRREYDRVVAPLAGKDEYLVRHILVGTRAQAQAALDRVKAGEPFADVAREVSQDPGSRNTGGDLGWNLPQIFIEEFSNTMTSLNPRGLATEPTRTRFGWHVIEVTAVRPFLIPPYEKVRDRVVQTLRRRAQAK